MSTAPVPKFSVICGDSFGTANYAMCGRAFGPRFTFVWPSARVAGMSGEEVAETSLAYEQSVREAEGKMEMSREEVEAFKETVKKDFESKISSWQSTAWVCDDGLIDPRDTRK